MRRTTIVAVSALAVALAVGGCGSAASSPTPPPDAGSVLTAASKASYPTKLEISIAGSVTSAGTTVSLPDKALTIDVDTSAGVGSFHLAIPVSVLGADAGPALKALGVTGDTLTVDALYDGKAVYAMSPLLPALIAQLSALSSGTPLPTLAADAWAKLIDEATLKQLASSATTAAASAAPISSMSPDDIKATLDKAGATMTLGAQTTGAGGPANDVKITIDPAKAKAYMLAHPEQFPSSQVSTISAMGDLSTVSFDVLVDVATSRVEQVSMTAAGKQDGKDVSATLQVNIGEAPASVSFAAPSDAVDVPLVKILGPLVGSMLGGGFPGASSAP